MKLTHQRMTTRYDNTPESLVYWLEEQLEIRGIDAVVYTRYILSLLQEDDTDSDSDNGSGGTGTLANTGIATLHSSATTGGPDMSGFCCEHMIRNIKPVTTNKWKHKRYLKQSSGGTGVGTNSCYCWPLSDYCSHSSMNSDEERKLAVVQCLKSASEQEFGIESFVDELCAKLKNIKLLSETTDEITIDLQNTTNNNNNNTTVGNNGIKPTLKEQAMKYFAAFPALDTNANEDNSTDSGNGSKTDGTATTGTIVIKRMANIKDSNKNRWNGQKIIDYMSSSVVNTKSSGGGGDSNGLTTGSGDELNGQTLTKSDTEVCKEKNNQLSNDVVVMERIDNIESNGFNNGIVLLENKDFCVNNSCDNSHQKGSELSADEIKRYFYCHDLETNICLQKNTVVSNELDECSSLVVNNSNNTNNKIESNCLNGFVVDSNPEESDKFQKLVNKFNSNIASIWSKEGDDSVLAKTDNIWTFDSSFSSNQSSATPSPKPLNAIDFWSSIAITEITDGINCKTGSKQVSEQMCPLPEISWETSLLQSLSVFPDDGFIDGNNDYINDECNWPTNTCLDKTCNESIGPTISLQNHQKNSPFIEFNTAQGTTPKTTTNTTITCDVGNDPALELTKLLSLLHKSKPRLTPPPSVDENLLTSPKTHFQPIRQDFMFDRDDSDEGSVADITDHEVNKLVICSDKCPNNGSTVDDSLVDKLAIKLRPVSTSLDELASYIGPFSDAESTSSAEFLTSLSVCEEMEFKNTIKDTNKMSDKSTNTELEIQLDVKSVTKLEPILESNVENEPEYQDLCNMINEVLRNGIAEDEPNGSTNTSSLTHTTTSGALNLDDWYDTDFADADCLDFIPVRNREKRLSWNYYWDTYDTSTSGGVNCAESTGFDTNPMNGKQLNRFAFNKELTETEEQNIRLCNEGFDEVFAEELYYNISGTPAPDDCPQPDYEGVFGDEEEEDYICGLEVDSDIDYDYYNCGVYGQTRRRRITDFDDRSLMSTGYTTGAIDSHMSASFGQPFRLQLKPRHSELVPKRNRKPCTYFIEGNCKRSDCKYSHDISAITCKYWEEGFCFKANLCPFLHGYADDNSILNTNNSNKKSMLSLKSKMKGYAIESESDFPSLATLPNSTGDENSTRTPIISTDEIPESTRLKQHFFDFRHRSVADNTNVSQSSTSVATITTSSTTGVSKAKLPIAVFMKKKVKKRKDRNLQ